jgi:hypothetical protein
MGIKNVTGMAAWVSMVAALSLPLHARKLLVGPGKTYAKPSLAAAAAHDGDTVEIDAVTYTGDACTWSADNLVLRGAGRFAHLDAQGANAQGKGTWVIDGKNTTIENIEFSGAKVDDQNGAGIRQEGPGVTIRHCYFHDNENGILADGGDMIIEYTEFAHNGLGEVGRTHNIYVSSATSFTLRYCYSHHAVIGHNVKSRAMKNFILYNRIMDEADGTSSYDIDLPNGGFSVVMGNLIQQGPNTDNSTIFPYGAEGLKNAPNELYVVNNTFVNDRQGGTFIQIAGGTTVAKVMNNLFVGQGTLISGKADTGGNVATANPGFVNRAAYDYRLTAGSPAIDKGKDAGAAGAVDLKPVFLYVHPVSNSPRVTAGAALDAGAYEFGDGNAVRKRVGLMRGGGAWRTGTEISAGGGDGWYAFSASNPTVWLNSLGERFSVPPGMALR